MHVMDRFRYVNLIDVNFFLVQEKGEWAITSVLHDATAVVSYFSFI